MNDRHKRTERALSSTVRIAHQSSMQCHTPTTYTPSQLEDDAYTIESIPMSYYIDSLAMRMNIRNRLWLPISHCTSRVLHYRIHNKSGKLLIHMNCNYTPSWHLCSHSIQLQSIEGVAMAERKDMCNATNRSGTGKQHHHRCD